MTSSASSKGGLFYEYKEKFAREAKNLSKLKHQNIVNVMEFFEANNTCYYVMEYLSGGDLDSLIEHRGRLSEADTLRYTKQIAELCPFEWQKKENIVYCDYLEHLLLHVLICKYPADCSDTSVGIGGVINFIAPELKYFNVEAASLGAVNSYS